LGDAILASPALAALHAEPERFSLTLITMFPSVTEYLQDQDFTDDVRFIRFLHMSRGTILKRALALRRERFDVSIVPYAMNRLGYNILNYVTGARRRIGFRYQRQRLVNLPQINQVVIDEDPKLHAVEENLRWAAALTERDPSSFNRDLYYRTPPDADQAAQDFLNQNGLGDAAPLIGVHAGCNSLKNQQRRCWPAPLCGELLERVGQAMPTARFLLFEGPPDVAINGAIRAALTTQARKLVTASMLPMRVVGALIRHCDLFVSNDSGLMHTAAACQVPCVALFGPTNPAWVRPWNTRYIIVSRHLSCSPCFYYSSRPLGCPAGLDFACMREIAVDQVLDALQNLLATSHGKTLAHPR
jgi:heptosyltransferase-2